MNVDNFNDADGIARAGKVRCRDEAVVARTDDDDWLLHQFPFRSARAATNGESVGIRTTRMRKHYDILATCSWLVRMAGKLHALPAS